MKKIKYLTSMWSTKNVENPKDIPFYTKKHYYFICKKNHIWKSMPSRALKCESCPYCNHRLPSKEYNLKAIYPNIANEWNYEKNIDVPENVLPSVSTKYFWKCKVGHEWKASVNSRSKGTGCPYCSHNLPSKEYNLKVVYPDVVRKWDYEKNKLLPENYLPHSEKKVWWVCEVNKNHKFKSAICNRVKANIGCPKCKKEMGTSFPEQALYFYLNKIFKDCKNRFKINGKEFDIYIPSLKLVIEYDGVLYHSSEKQIELDCLKNNILFDNNIDLLRIKEIKNIKETLIVKDNIFFCKVDSCYNYLNVVIPAVIKYINKKYHRKYDIKIDVINDNTKIYNNFLSLKKGNSLIKVKPYLLEEWDYKKNKNIKPEYIRPYSRIRIWWKCKNGHSWVSNASNRMSNHNCPYCCNQKIDKTNSFAFYNPQLIKYWNYNKNKDLTPDNVSKKSGKYVWWICEEGHEFKKMIKEFVEHPKCPFCISNRVKDKK